MDNNYYGIAFKDLPIGAEFLWGGFTIARSHWGRKRSSRTADYILKVRGNLEKWQDWAYWKANETVYVLRNQSR